ncbi:sulfatase [Paraglaciecola aquimarina]|uniref:Sulfatase n=1 Tax=Paraglaciecola aquimarina TaxID=1235557 RepID=A0ABU3T2D1_9ALTE|nr:sulfatase [Paraglaciecola aquimarina]MDU0356429.1 sulfatase [Paraglaciecola aquimarina]
MFTRIIGFLVIVVFTACSQPVATQKNLSAEQNMKKPTNILWIYIEDQNPWNSAYGDDTVSTPTIKEFAATGVRFNNTMQLGPVCSATRSALITGQYQTTLGLHQHRSNRSSYNGVFLPEGYKTVPELFADAGYQTFNIGKDDYNFKYDRSKLYNAQQGIKGWQGAYDGEKFDWAKTLKDKPFFGQIQLKGGKHHVKQAAVDRINPDKMVIPPYYPDAPEHRKEWAKHYATIEESDRELKEILTNLENNGLLENTAIFWFSDHGMILLRHKQDLYEGGVKVPFIVNWPAGNHLLTKKGSVRDDLISGLDIPATSLALAGIEVPEYYDGKNLFADDFTGRDYVISAKDRMDYSFDRSRSVRSKKYRYIRNFHPEIPRSQPQYRDGKAFSIEFATLFKQGKLTPVQARYFDKTKPAEELYDLEKDPHQINNLASSEEYKAALLEHRKVLQDWIESTDDKGAYPESEQAIKETLDLWGKSCVSQECQTYRREHADTLQLPGDQVYKPLQWPNYLPKPNHPALPEIENLYRKNLQ